jgi:transcriptional regulator with XRE-family HTH domain
MRLDIYLEKNNIPVEQFADKIGVHRTSVYRFMKGLAFPRKVTIERIIAATGGKVRADDFFDDPGSSRQRDLAATG